MLTVANPAALVGFLALPVLWWLHRARQRPRDLEWPSLLLWKNLPPPTPQALARHRRRLDLVLWLALGGTASLVAGAVGPAVVVLAPEPVRVGVVVDATASARGSWEAIVSDADAFLAGLPGGTMVDLAIVPGESRAGLTPAEARTRLVAAVPTDAPGDPAAAAARFAQDVLVAAFSDRPGPADIAAWRVHATGPDEAGVIALSVAGGRALAVVSNARERRPVGWTLTSSAGISKGVVVIPGSGVALVETAAPDTGAPFTFAVDRDRFPANDARHWAPAGESVAIGMGGRDCPPLRRGLEAAGLAPVQGGSNPRVWVGEVPEASPAPAVVVDPARGLPGVFEIEGFVEGPEVILTSPEDPLVRAAVGADLARLTVQKSTRLRFLRPVRTLVAPLVYECEGLLVFAFDPSPPNSNFSRLVAFPLVCTEIARRFNPSPRRQLSTGAPFGGQVLTQSGLLSREGGVWAVNLDDPSELLPSSSPPARPALDLPSRTVIRSRSALPPAAAAIAGLTLLILSWLAQRVSR